VKVFSISCPEQWNIEWVKSSTKQRKKLSWLSTSVARFFEILELKGKPRFEVTTFRWGIEKTQHQSISDAIELRTTSTRWSEQLNRLNESHQPFKLENRHNQVKESFQSMRSAPVWVKMGTALRKYSSSAINVWVKSKLQLLGNGRSRESKSMIRSEKEELKLKDLVTCFGVSNFHIRSKVNQHRLRRVTGKVKHTERKEKEVDVKRRRSWIPNV